MLFSVTLQNVRNVGTDKKKDDILPELLEEPSDAEFNSDDLNGVDMQYPVQMQFRYEMVWII